MGLSTWYHVSFDEEWVYLDISGEKTRFRFDEITRVCYQLWSFMMTDELYIFTRTRKESYLIPVEAAGGAELWGEIIDRGLFDAQLAIDIMSKDIGLYCWPPEEK